MGSEIAPRFKEGITKIKRLIKKGAGGVRYGNQGLNDEGAKARRSGSTSSGASLSLHPPVEVSRSHSLFALVGLSGGVGGNTCCYWAIKSHSIWRSLSREILTRNQEAHSVGTRVTLWWGWREQRQLMSNQDTHFVGTWTHSPVVLGGTR